MATDNKLDLNNENLREALAECMHKAWSNWMFHLFAVSPTVERDGALVPQLTVENTNRWLSQVMTKYADLSEKEKESDRLEADKIIKIISDFNNSNMSDKKQFEEFFGKFGIAWNEIYGEEYMTVGQTSFIFDDAGGYKYYECDELGEISYSMKDKLEDLT